MILYSSLYQLINITVAYIFSDNTPVKAGSE